MASDGYVCVCARVRVSVCVSEGASPNMGHDRPRLRGRNHTAFVCHFRLEVLCTSTVDGHHRATGG